MKLKDIERGGVFCFGGINWIVLEFREGAALVLAENSGARLKSRVFSMDDLTDGQDCADWRESYARQLLTDKVLPRIIQNSDGQADKIQTMTVDLLALDGSFRETSKDRIALLSVDQYRRNRDVIPLIHYESWTLTRSTATAKDRIITIKTDGTLRLYGSTFASDALRPLLLLSTDAEVEPPLVNGNRPKASVNSAMAAQDEPDPAAEDLEKAEETLEE